MSTYIDAAGGILQHGWPL